MEGREIRYGDTLPCVGLGGGMQVSGVGCSPFGLVCGDLEGEGAGITLVARFTGFGFRRMGAGLAGREGGE